MMFYRFLLISLLMVQCSQAADRLIATPSVVILQTIEDRMGVRARIGLAIRNASDNVVRIYFNPASVRHVVISQGIPKTDQRKIYWSFTLDAPFPRQVENHRNIISLQPSEAVVISSDLNLYMSSSDASFVEVVYHVEDGFGKRLGVWSGDLSVRVKSSDFFGMLLDANPKSKASR